MFKLNQKGMSLVEVLVAMSIAAMTSLATMKIGENTMKTSNYATSKFSLQQFEQMSIALPLSDPAECALNFGGKPSAGMVDDDFIYPNEIRRDATNVLVTSVAPNNVIAGGDWRINSMEMLPFAAGISGTVGRCDLRLNMTRLKKAFGAVDKIITIPISCTLDGSSNISACSAGGSNNSNIWTLNYDPDGYEFAQYLPGGGQPGYVLIGTDPNTNAEPEEAEAGLYINMDGKEWLSDPSIFKGIRLKTDNAVAWDEWAVHEGLDADYTDPNGPVTAPNIENCMKTSGWNGAGVTNYVQVCRMVTRVRNQLKSYGDNTIYNSDTPDNHVSIGKWWASGDTSSFLSFNFYRNIWTPATGASPWMMSHNFQRFGSAGVDDGGGLILNNKVNGGFEFYSVPAGSATKTAATSLDDQVLRINKTEAVFHESLAAADARNYTLGPLNVNTGSSALVVGDNNLSTGDYSTNIGTLNRVDGNYSSGFGRTNTVTGNFSFGAGSLNTVFGDYGSAFGRESLAMGDYAFAAGYQARARKVHSISLGRESLANGPNSTAIGPFAYAPGQNSLALSSSDSGSGGYPAKATGYSSVAIGRLAIASGTYSVAIGRGNGGLSVASGQQAFASGHNTTASGDGAVAFGTNLEASGDSTAIFGVSPWGIYTAAGDDEAHFVGQAKAVLKATGGNTEISASGDVDINAGWDPKVNKAWVVASDRRLKTNIKKLDEKDTLEKLLSIEPAVYELKSNKGKSRYGLIAQNVQKTFPEAVKEGKDGYLGVTYTMLISPIIASVKFLYSQIEELFTRSNKLEESIEKMNLRLERLEQENRELKRRLEVEPSKVGK